jgi:RND family efflux transporter MFP subunit
MVEPVARVDVVAESTARIIARHAQVGKRLEKGDPFFELDGAVTQIQLNAAQAELETALALLDEAEAEFKTAGDLEDDELEDQTKARRDAAAASVRLAETRLEEAQIAHQRRLIEAPIDGVVSQCYLDEGEFAAAGRPVAEIVATNPVHVVVSLTAQEVELLGKAAASWRVAGGPGSETREAKLSSQSPVADARTKQFDFTLEVNNDDGRLMLGSKVDVVCQWKSEQPALTVPRKALLLRDDNLVCFRIDREEETDVWRETEVRIASIPGAPELVRVLDGLAMDDRVAVGQLMNLRDGLKVSVGQ